MVFSTTPVKTFLVEIISTTFLATSQAKGLPPKVLPCVPG